MNIGDSTLYLWQHERENEDEMGNIGAAVGNWFVSI